MTSRRHLNTAACSPISRVYAPHALSEQAPSALYLRRLSDGGAPRLDKSVALRGGGGALPLALGTGEGSELRRPLGIAIVGGLLLSQILTLYTTPVVYLALDSLRLRFAKRRQTTPPRQVPVAG